ncbi:MAG: imidazoleglycerol-phosphate dehydratase HisB [Syntrophales bacterium]
MVTRKAKIQRKTTATTISIDIGLNDRGEGNISTTIPFMDHMLTLFARHALMDLVIKCKADKNIDDHHLVENIGICLGDAVKEAIGDKKRIALYGTSVIPMDESLCNVIIDLSGRPCLIYNVKFKSRKVGEFDYSLIKRFFQSFSKHSGMTLHINLLYGQNDHHIAEAIFKAFALALRTAVTIHAV